MKKTLVIILSLFALTVLLSGCGYGSKISFDTNGGSNIWSKRVSETEIITLPNNPTKEGYLFTAWYIDEELTTLFNLDELIVEDITLYADWNPVVRKVFLMYDESIIAGFYIDYSEVIQLPDVSLTGYMLEGWYTDIDLVNSVESITGDTDDVYIYGKFEETDLVVPDEVDISIDSLPYYDYLSDTNPVVTITVENIGVIELQLFPDVAKNTVDNFINYITTDAYTDSTFHRVIEDFMIQGGMVDNTLCSVSGEFTSNGYQNDLSHFRGVLSLARTSEVDSGTSQFFIVHADYPSLDTNYATFGGMVSGFNVLDYIASNTKDSNDKPFRDIIIESITVELNGYVTSSPVCAD